MVGVGNLPGLELALRRMSGTVTTFLEELVGEPIDACDRRHRSTDAKTPNPLRVASGDPLIVRTAALRGRTSGRSFLYAETVLAPGRLTSAFCERLESSSDPIGRILEAEGIAVRRVPLGGPPSGSPPVAPEGDDGFGQSVLARSYRIDSEGIPLMVVSEWFLASLGEFLPPP